MIKPNDPLPVGSYVELKDGVDPAFYAGFSRVGNKGWIRKKRKDKYGYPQVFIEWNPHDWSYNGAPDGWTWSEHFKLANETEKVDMNQPTPDPQEQLRKAVTKATEEFVTKLFGALGVQEPAEEIKGGSEENDISGIEDHWTETVIEAHDAIENSKAFVVIALHEDGRSGLLTPVIFQEAQDPESALVAQSQIGHYLMMSHDDLIGHTIRELQEQSADEEE